MKTRIEGAASLIVSFVALYWLASLRHISPGHEATLVELITALIAVVSGLCGAAMTIVGPALFREDKWPPKPKA